MSHKSTYKCFEDYSAEDLAMEESFIEWVNDPNSAHRHFWEQWSIHNPQKNNEVELAKMIILTVGGEQQKISKQEIDNEWNALISSEKKVKNRDLDLWRSKYLVRAAVFLLFFVFTGVLFLAISRDFLKDVPNQLIEKHTKSGQKLTTRLPDGSKVILNAQSTISYAADFDEGAREVYLKGEAYFDVAHHPTKQFIVHVKDFSTNVFGTTFNIRSYADGPLQIALESGSIQIRNKTNDIDQMLKPGEAITINTAGQRYEVEKYNHREVFGWRDGYICFNKSSFPEALKILERWYGVEFVVEEGVKLDSSWKFHGKFHNKSLTYVLHALSYPDIFNYKIKNGRVAIY